MNYLKFYKQTTPVKMLSDTERANLLEEIFKLDYEYFLSKFSIEVGNGAFKSGLIRPEERKRHAVEGVGASPAHLRDHTEEHFSESNHRED